MSKSIRLSPAHGVNPTIPVCFWCGNEKNEVALMGKLPNDAEAPRNAIIDYEPCDACKARMEKGITLIGAVDHPLPDGRPAICKDAYPTGHWLTVKPEGIRSVIREPLATDIINQGCAVIDDDTLLSLIPKELRKEE